MTKPNGNFWIAREMVRPKFADFLLVSKESSLYGQVKSKIEMDHIMISAPPDEIAVAADACHDAGCHLIEACL